MPSEEQATGTLEEIGQRDHSVTAEYRIFGAPGCGKTTNITRQVKRAVEKHGADAVLVTSYSRTAAAELAGRDLPIASDRVGTLHSHCYHALGRPVIAESCVDEWNRDNPHLAITPAKKQVRLDSEGAGAEDDTELAKNGDEILRELSRMRGLMIPQNRWPIVLSQFEQKWTAYKHATWSARLHRSDRDVLPGRLCRAQAPGGHLRGRGTGPQPDAVDAHPEMGRARELLHSCG